MLNTLNGLFIAAVLAGTPLLLGALGEILTEKSGNLNLGVEGMMFMGAITGLAGSYYYEQAVIGSGGNPNGAVSSVIALLTSFAAGSLGALIYSFLTITLRANQNVTGLTLTIFGTGFGNFFGEYIGQKAGGYVAAPSANTSGRPSPTTASHVKEDLGERIDMILDGGTVGIGLESTIVDFTEEMPVVLRPGYISLEMLKETLGEVKMDKGLISPDSKVRPKAPGMKYRHYAPKAELSIVEGEISQVVKAINDFAKEAEKQGKKAGIIATEETKEQYTCGIVKCIGSREETIAHNLYEVLREFDQCEADVIYSEAFYTPRMGQAIMNRLLKAAGHKIINIQEETSSN